MTLKDLLKKKEKIKEAHSETVEPPPEEPEPEFTFFRSDTNTQQVITPPSFSDDPYTNKQEQHHISPFSRLRTSSHRSTTSRPSSKGKEQSRPSSKDKDSRRLSQRLHISRSNSRSTSQTSTNLPADLPDIGPLTLQSEEEKQAAWEERATILAKENPNNRRPLSSHSTTSTHSHRSTQASVPQPDFHPAHLGDKPARGRSISDAKSDDDIQKAIRLHEAGDLVESTAMFGRLADNNAMAQILYGLALRHGWGITADPVLGITYLSRAASSSASVEADALEKGAKKGGAAKGELVLAIYELANSFRHGWGVEKDPVAARKYYEVAANLGDTDAMNEAGRCFEEGYGGKKDRVRMSFVFHFSILECIQYLWLRLASLAKPETLHRCILYSIQSSF